MDMNISWESDDDYMKFIQRMNPPMVVIHNEANQNATVVEVGGTHKYGTLLEVVQALTDLNLLIKKAYISSDGEWFMDVFNVTGRDGKKLRDSITINVIGDYIRKSLGADSWFHHPTWRRYMDAALSTDCTSIELTGTDRPGLLCEVSAVLTELKCNIVNAEVWTHNTRAAAVIHVTDESAGSAITDPKRISKIKELLYIVVMGCDKVHGAKVAVSGEITHIERRLHQMMSADRAYERSDKDLSNANNRSSVTVINCYEKDYSVVTVRCEDRPKLLFDIVCTLTDMKYVVFHGNVDTKSPEAFFGLAYLELYIRHVDGKPILTDAERHRVIQLVEAAIGRRVSEGLKLELCTCDRVGLLTDITRIFRENCLTITRAEISTRAGQAIDTFSVCDVTGNPVDAKTIDFICQLIGQTNLRVKHYSEYPTPSLPQDPPVTAYRETRALPEVHPRPFIRTISWNSVVNCVYSPPSL